MLHNLIMKISLYFIFTFALAIGSYLLGRNSCGSVRAQNLKVAFADEEHMPAERQLLALMYAYPQKDAEAAFMARDLRPVVSHIESGQDYSQIRVIPLGDLSVHPNQDLVDQLADRYAAFYNKRMEEMKKQKGRSQ